MSVILTTCSIIVGESHAHVDVGKAHIHCTIVSELYNRRVTVTGLTVVIQVWLSLKLIM